MSAPALPPSTGMRPAHLAGSVPADDPESAMRSMLDAVGDRLPILRSH